MAYAAQPKQPAVFNRTPKPLTKRGDAPTGGGSPTPPTTGRIWPRQKT